MSTFRCEVQLRVAKLEGRVIAAPFVAKARETRTRKWKRSDEDLVISSLGLEIFVYELRI